MSRIVYLNGQFVPESDAKLSIYDLSVMQAAAAFEMTRSFNGAHFKMHEHLVRLERSCNLLGIPMPHDRMQLEDICLAVSSRNDHGPGEEHRLLIVVSPGCAPMYKDLAGVIPHPFVYIADFPLRYTVAGFSKYFTEGVKCSTSGISPISFFSIPPEAKHRSRLHFHLAQQQAPEGTWPLMKWPGEGHIHNFVEAPGANVVRICDDTLYLHKHDALQGISLATVEELAKQLGWRVRDHARDEWYGVTQEMWLTGTPFCALSVTSLDGEKVGNGTIGPRYKQMLKAWSELVGVDIQKQIELWDYENLNVPMPLWTPDAQRTRST